MLELFRKIRLPLMIACLLLAALLFYSAQLTKRAHTTLFEKGLLALSSPLQKVLDSAFRGQAELWNHYLWLVDAAKENERLQLENQQLQAELAGVAEVRLASERLQRLLDLKAERDVPSVAARVVAEDATSWFRTVVINKGSDHGLREGLSVVTPVGAVGRIIKCSRGAARVLLVTDASSAAAALLQRSRSRGVCRGEGELLTLEFVGRREDVQEGDLVVTSGMGGVFPKGLSLGTVTAVSQGEAGLFQSIQVTPAVDFSRLEEVLVLLKD